MTADLSVNLDAIADTEGMLVLLMNEFDQSAQIVDDYRSVVGHSGLCSALDDFATNWKKHKEQLISQMDSVRGMAANGHEAFIGADDQLAKSITGDTISHLTVG